MLWPPGTVHGNSASYESQSPRFKSLSQYLGSLDEKGMFSKLHRYDKHINKHQQTEFKWLNGSNPFTVTSTLIGIIRAQPEGAPTLHCDFALGSVRSIWRRFEISNWTSNWLGLSTSCSIVSLPFWAKLSLSHPFSTKDSKNFQVVPGGSLSSCSFILHRIWGCAGMLLIIYL